MTNLTMKLIFLGQMFLATSNLMAQNTIESSDAARRKDTLITQIHISGIVKDLSPLPRVIVIEKGFKDNTTMTGRDGRFELAIPLEHFTSKVYLRFEILERTPMEIEIFPDTKFVKLEWNYKDPSLKWKAKFVAEKPDIAELILKRLAFLVKKVKENND